MTKDTKMVLRHVRRRGSFIGSGVLIGALMGLGTAFATCGSTCGESASTGVTMPEGAADGSGKGAEDAGARLRDGGKHAISDVVVRKMAEEGVAEPTNGEFDGSGDHGGIGSGGGAEDGGTPMSDAGTTKGEVDAFPGSTPDAQQSAPNPSCLFNGLSCEGDASNSCCTFCQNGACGGCFARGVQLPPDGGLCCVGAGAVVTVGTVSYCGTDLCLADGVACGDAGGKPCCNGQCNGVVCGGV